MLFFRVICINVYAIYYSHSLLFLTCKCEEDTLSTQNENTTEEFCSKDDIKCGKSDDNIDEAEYNQYKHKETYIYIS